MEERGRHQRYSETLNKGKRAYKTYHYLENDGTFNIVPPVRRIVCMSDIHSATPAVVSDMIKKRIINGETVVLCTGDMAGDGTMGGDGDPIGAYRSILEHAFALYFVQGNHDTENPAVYELRNRDGTPCCVHGLCIDTIIGKVAGVNGIIGNPSKQHRTTKDAYTAALRRVLSGGPDILLTHQPPRLEPEASTVDTKYEGYPPQAVPLHICGHYAYEPNYRVQTAHGIILNCDNRILDIR